jgi:hypothetical protein
MNANDGCRDKILRFLKALPVIGNAAEAIAKVGNLLSNLLS